MEVADAPGTFDQHNHFLAGEDQQQNQQEVMATSSSDNASSSMSPATTTPTTGIYNNNQSPINSSSPSNINLDNINKHEHFIMTHSDDDDDDNDQHKFLTQSYDHLKLDSAPNDDTLMMSDFSEQERRLDDADDHHDSYLASSSRSEHEKTVFALDSNDVISPKHHDDQGDVDDEPMPTFERHFDEPIDHHHFEQSFSSSSKSEPHSVDMMSFLKSEQHHEDSSISSSPKHDTTGFLPSKDLTDDFEHLEFIKTADDHSATFTDHFSSSHNEQLGFGDHSSEAPSFEHSFATKLDEPFASSQTAVSADFEHAFLKTEPTLVQDQFSPDNVTFEQDFSHSKEQSKTEHDFEEPSFLKSEPHLDDLEHASSKFETVFEHSFVAKVEPEPTPLEQSFSNEEPLELSFNKSQHEERELESSHSFEHFEHSKDEDFDRFERHFEEEQRAKTADELDGVKPNDEEVEIEDDKLQFSGSSKSDFCDDSKQRHDVEERQVWAEKIVSSQIVETPREEQATRLEVQSANDNFHPEPQFSSPEPAMNDEEIELEEEIEVQIVQEEEPEPEPEKISTSSSSSFKMGAHFLPNLSDLPAVERLSVEEMAVPPNSAFDQHFSHQVLESSLESSVKPAQETEMEFKSETPLSETAPEQPSSSLLLQKVPAADADADATLLLENGNHQEEAQSPAKEQMEETVVPPIPIASSTEVQKVAEDVPKAAETKPAAAKKTDAKKQQPAEAKKPAEKKQPTKSAVEPVAKPAAAAAVKTSAATSRSVRASHAPKTAAENGEASGAENNKPTSPSLTAKKATAASAKPAEAKTAPVRSSAAPTRKSVKPATTENGTAETNGHEAKKTPATRLSLAVPKKQPAVEGEEGAKKAPKIPPIKAPVLAAAATNGHDSGDNKTAAKKHVVKAATTTAKANGESNGESHQNGHSDEATKPSSARVSRKPAVPPPAKKAAETDAEKNSKPTTPRSTAKTTVIVVKSSAAKVRPKSAMGVRDDSKPTSSPRPATAAAVRPTRTATSTSPRAKSSKTEAATNGSGKPAWSSSSRVHKSLAPTATNGESATANGATSHEAPKPAKSAAVPAVAKKTAAASETKKQPPAAAAAASTNGVANKPAAEKAARPAPSSAKARMSTIGAIGGNANGHSEEPRQTRSMASKSASSAVNRSLQVTSTSSSSTSTATSKTAAKKTAAPGVPPPIKKPAVAAVKPTAVNGSHQPAGENGHGEVDSLAAHLDAAATLGEHQNGVVAATN